MEKNDETLHETEETEEIETEEGVELIPRSPLEWIKLKTDMFDDRRIDAIDAMPDRDAIMIVWIKILTLAGVINCNGFIFITETLPYTEELLAHKFKRPIGTVKAALSVLRQLGMIEIDKAGLIHVVKWSKHQIDSDKFEQIKQQGRERQKRFYDNKKKKSLEYSPIEYGNGNGGGEEENDNVPNVSLTLGNEKDSVSITSSNVSLTEQKEKEKENKEKNISFSSPHPSHTAQDFGEASLPKAKKVCPSKKAPSQKKEGENGEDPLVGSMAKKFLDYHYEKYRQRFGATVSGNLGFKASREMAQLKPLMRDEKKQYKSGSYEKLVELNDLFFSTDDFMISRSDYMLPTFLYQISRLTNMQLLKKTPRSASSPSNGSNGSNGSQYDGSYGGAGSEHYYCYLSNPKTDPSAQRVHVSAVPRRAVVFDRSGKTFRR